ncbi:uncharacterized protein LOC128867942 [Anastrepha ludens]|uniref:uncharacterized protein LOC128867942 n=1 Tax=Anastrepha ludens TaxID=28586 RepID=UPI0023B0045C|nr:uncharacterized protein LOC128867942 [Anastrepha ludens]
MPVTTAAAAYMISAMKSLQVLFPKMLHVTCFAHGLHRLVEFIRSEFHEGNLLISKVKAAFVKSTARRQLFKQSNPDIPLPLEPIVTRWGTWLQACDYYADKFDAIKSVVDYLNGADSECNQDGKKSVSSVQYSTRFGIYKS